MNACQDRAACGCGRDALALATAAAAADWEAFRSVFSSIAFERTVDPAHVAWRLSRWLIRTLELDLDADDLGGLMRYLGAKLADEQ